MNTLTLSDRLDLHDKWTKGLSGGVRFKATGRELEGLYLANCNLAGADLREINLYVSGAELCGVNLCGADLRGAKIETAFPQNTRGELPKGVFHGTSFRGADLRGARFSHCDFSGADLTDVITDYDVPEIPQIDAKIAEALNTPPAALEMARWHTCGTTHCRAGWAVHLAGDDGYALKHMIGDGAAGSLIYAKSRPNQPIPSFYHFNNGAVRADIEKCAAEQLAAPTPT